MRVLNEVLKNLTFFCELKKKRMGPLFLLVPTPVGPHRDFF